MNIKYLDKTIITTKLIIFILILCLLSMLIYVYVITNKANYSLKGGSEYDIK